MIRLALVLTIFAALGGAACQSAFAPEPVLRLETPKADLPATTSREAAVLSGPDRRAVTLATLPAGATLTAGDKSYRGYRRVKTADGKTGYVEEAALQVGAAAVAPAAPAPEKAPAASEAPAEAAPAAAPQG